MPTLPKTHPIAAVVAAAWLAACDTSGVTAPPPAEAVFLAFGPTGTSKLAAIPESGLTVTKTVYGDDEVVLRIREGTGEGPRDDLTVALAIPGGAAPAGVTIAMTVRGNLLSQLQVAFEPDQLVFAKAAELSLDVGLDLVDIDLALLTAYHHYADGTIVAAPFRLEQKRDRIRILVAVDGFSRYSLSDGE